VAPFPERGREPLAHLRVVGCVQHLVPTPLHAVSRHDCKRSQPPVHLQAR
jgi:hypothetical protein